MFRKIFTLIVLCSLVGTFTLAQTTGRISGKVVDQQSGEPLIGANVLVEGTSYGAATDVNGEYLISQIPAGTYNIKASYIGYQNVVVRGVSVVAGLTQNVGFKLPSSAIATGEVVIVSKKPLIQKSATNAIRIVGSEDLQSLPVRNISDIVALQPGVVQQNGLTFIRGSRPDETGYMLEGADVKNVLSRNGGSLVDVTPDALQEILVQAGGYTAEYGNANAGIVSQDFRTGTDQYHVSVRAETDNFGNYPGKKFLGTYSYGYSDYVLTVSGPIYTKKLKLFLSGENHFVRDYTPHFFDSNPATFSDGAPMATTKVHDTGFYGGNTSDYQYLTWDGGNIAGRMDNRYTLNGTLLFNNNPLTIRVAGAYTFSKRRSNSPDIVSMFDTQRLPITDNSNMLLNAKATYLLTPNSFIEANLNFYDSHSKTYDPYFKDNFLSYSDSLANAQNGFTFYNYFTSPVSYDFYGFPFDRPGATLTGLTKNHNSYIGGSVAYTAQIEKHSIKVGGSYQRWTVRHWGNGSPSNTLSSLRQNPDAAANKDSLEAYIGNALYRNFNNYGYDVFGNEINSGDFAPKHPVLASAYVEDRIEVSDLIINAGLRYDYINMDSWSWTNPLLPVVNDQTHLIPSSAIGQGSTFSYISPRLGFSFPVTDRTVFHMQYGKFVQQPSLDVAYRGMYQAAQQLTGSNLFTNPIAYDPKPIRTTQYEIGFSQQFTDFAAFDVTAFYKDIKGQLQYAAVLTAPGAARSKYNVFANQDFSTTEGLELSLKIRRIDRVRAEINYTFSNAEGTNSFSGSGIGSTEVNGDVPTVLIPLTYNQTHRGSIVLDYRFGKDDGGPILQQLGLNLLFTFNSGHPFTYAQDLGLGQSSAWTGGLIPVGSGDTRGRRPIGPINSATTPWVYNLNLRIDKTVDIYNFNVNFYVYVQNLLNTKNVENVYQKTGNAYDDGFLNSTAGQQIISGSRYTQRFADLYQALNLTNREAAMSVYGYDLFSAPRQLRLGVLVNF